MWELISANKRKSAVLFLLLGGCLIGIGYAIGSYYYPDAGIGGVGFAVALWLLLSAIAYYSGDDIFLYLAGAKQVTSEAHPQLFNVVEEMKIAANLPSMPKVYIIDEEAMNAFAVGRNPQKCAIAVTAGLAARLDRDELQGVIAHEMSHIINRDSLYMTFAGVTLGAIIILSNIFWRSSQPGAIRYRYKSSASRDGLGQLAIVFTILSMLFVILGSLAARMLYFAISRRREYLADASAVRLTRYPQGLADALEKISGDMHPLMASNTVTAPMFIVRPLSGDKPMRFSWESTHPPIAERIKILRNISSGANYIDYQESYSQIMGRKQNIIPHSGLTDKSVLALRKTAARKSSIPTRKDSRRVMGDLMMNLNNYLFINCACGLKIKIPPELDKPDITCPRCGHFYLISQVLP